MDQFELKSYLTEYQPSREYAFQAVQSLCALTHVHGDNSPVVQELLLYMIDRRELFVPYEEIINSLIRKCGLFPYLVQDSLNLSDAVAFEFHKFKRQNLDIVFHRQQYQVYSSISEGENVVLSAPTSFGKSLIIEALVASRQFDNIVVILPTIALVDEVRRCLKKYSPYYKVVTHNSQVPDIRNIFVFTQERFFESEHLPRIDFFVIDEFYKLNPASTGEDNTRCYTLNKVFYRLLKSTGRFYLLGPNIEAIDFNLPSNITHKFIKTDFKTVAANIIYYPLIKKAGKKKETKIERLIRLCSELHESTLVYCYSPANATAVALALEGLRDDSKETNVEFSDWLKDNYHPNWVLAKSIRKGIGIHHGKLPRAISQYCIKRFNSNDDDVVILVCTSTMIEGVNTKAKNIVIYDNTIGANKKFDFFTFNNICGRSGRMLKHFVGNIFLFHHPPQQELPIVSPPILSQSEGTSTSLLIELDSEDISQMTKNALEAYINNKYLPLYLLKKNSRYDLEAQVILARQLTESPDYYQFLTWSGFPNRDVFSRTCTILFQAGFIGANKSAGYENVGELISLLWQFRASGTVGSFIKSRTTGLTDEKAINRTIDACLYFVKNTMSYGLPNALNALDLIQTHVFTTNERQPGSYLYFSGLIENCFQDPLFTILDEYGLPSEIANKLSNVLLPYDSVDQALATLASYDATESLLSPFEKRWLSEVQREL